VPPPPQNRITRWEMNVAEENITQLLGISEDELHGPDRKALNAQHDGRRRLSLLAPALEEQPPSAASAVASATAPRNGAPAVPPPDASAAGGVALAPPLAASADPMSMRSDLPPLAE
jgi:hypothetical protein